jgi:hypothetical protein
MNNSSKKSKIITIIFIMKKMVLDVGIFVSGR